jgi:pyruvate, water dikinase
MLAFSPFIAKVLMQPIVWLNELQDTHLSEVGAACLQLRQLQGTGCPIQEGFILPSPLLVHLVDSIDWQDTLLQDFPHLNLKFDLEDPLAIQDLTNQIQEGIRCAPIPTFWETVWCEAVSRLHQPWLMLKPYFWSDPSPSPLSLPMASTGHLCKNQPAELLNGIQHLWAEVFSIQNILLLQHQGIRLGQVRVSILVQPLPCPVVSGWLQVTKSYCSIQAILGSPQGLWRGEALPEQWVSDSMGNVLYQQSREQPFAHWLRPIPSLVSINGNGMLDLPQPIPHHQQQAPILAPERLQELLSLGRSLSQRPFTLPITLAWILHRPPHCHSPQLLLYAVDNDLPLPPPPAALWSPAMEAVLSFKQALQPEVESLLKGIGVSPGQRVAPLLVAQSLQDIRPESLANTILVTPTLDTVHFPWLRAAAGCICETGSPVSHGAILSRELGCPAIMGVQGATQVLQSGQWVMMDGQSGFVYPHSASIPLPSKNDLAPSLFLDEKTRTKLLVTLSHPDRLDQMSPQPIDGIGLIRGEWLLLNSLTEQASSLGLGSISVKHWQACQQSLRKLIQAVSPLPVFYRLIDFGAVNPEVLSFPESHRFPPERHRGVPFSAARPDCRGLNCHLLDHQLLQAELGMLREVVADGMTNLHLILPFVRSVQEVVFCQEQLQAVGLQPGKQISLWIMAEVPSVFYLLDQYAQLDLQGIAIGLNDLTQLLLGVDRNHHDFWDCLQTNRSVVMTAVTELVQKAQTLGFQTMLCGELRSYPALFLKQLIQAGLSAFAVDLSHLETMHNAIAQAEAELAAVALADPSVTNS